jgi:hypothetical protein
VYEETEHGYEWVIYEFQRNSAMLAPNSPRGPSEGPHGLRVEVFEDQRLRMIGRPVLFEWTQRKSPLTSDSLVDMFTEAAQ